MLIDILLILIHPLCVILCNLILLLQYLGELHLAELHLLPQFLVLPLQSAQVVLVLGRPDMDLLVEPYGILMQLVLQ